jgi:hypothetical protein
MKTVRLTLHNGEDVLINWESVAFATPSVSDTTRETFTKLVFNSSTAHEVDVRETLEEVNAVLLNIGNEPVPPKTAKKGK